MTEIGRPDSLVRGACVFAAYVVGVLAVMNPGTEVIGAVVAMALAFVASNYVDRSTP